MRFMIIRKADANTEGEDRASPELMEAMAAYNLEMIRAGVFLGGDGLRPSRDGARVRVSRDGAAPVVTDGPFAETKELVAGYMLIRADSLQDALDWVRRWPREDAPVELEVRRLYELEDFETQGEAPEAWREMEQAMKTPKG
jgi:PhnB protein